MNVVKTLSCAALLFAVSCASKAETVDMAQINATLDRSPRMCPARLVEVRLANYNEHCGENYLKTMSTSAALQCQNETDAENRKIEEYNALIRRCTATGSRPAASTSKSSSVKGNGFLAGTTEQPTQPRPAPSTSTKGGFLLGTEPKQPEPSDQKSAASRVTDGGIDRSREDRLFSIRACLKIFSCAECNDWRCTRFCFGERAACISKASGEDDATVRQRVLQSYRETDEAQRLFNEGANGGPSTEVDLSAVVDAMTGIINSGGSGQSSRTYGNRATNPTFEGGLSRRR